MYRRLLAVALILVTALQGPALTYAATLGSTGSGDSTMRACGSYTLPDGNDCITCCFHGSMPSCAAQCSVPVTAAVPLMLPTSLRIALHGGVLPDAGIAPFAEHDPPHPLRPPIV